MNQQNSIKQILNKLVGHCTSVVNDKQGQSAQCRTAGMVSSFLLVFVTQIENFNLLTIGVSGNHGTMYAKNRKLSIIMQ